MGFGQIDDGRRGGAGANPAGGSPFALPGPAGPPPRSSTGPSYEVHVHVPAAAPAQPSGSGHWVALVVGIVAAALVLGVLVRVGLFLFAWNRGVNALPQAPWPAAAPPDLPIVAFPPAAPPAAPPADLPMPALPPAGSAGVEDWQKEHSRRIREAQEKFEQQAREIQKRQRELMDKAAWPEPPGKPATTESPGR